MSDDYAASAATTGMVAVGGSATGNIEATFDHDWFAITLTAGHVYQFQIEGSATGQGTLNNPYLNLLNNAGGGVLNGVSITYAPLADGAYYLDAQSIDAGSFGTYKISAVDLGPGGGADDYADSVATTGVVAVGGSATGNIETLLDQDWFAITLAAGHTYQFDLQGAQSAQGTLFNPQLLLRDDVGASISANDNNNSSLDSQITFAITESKTYFLSALSSGAGGVGTYTLTATDLGTTADDYAASTSTTGVVAVGGSVTGNIETLLDQDWFAITLAAGHTYQFDLQGAQSAQGTLFNPQLLLRDDVGASISANDNNNSSLDSQITFAITESKTYFLSALSSGAGGVGTYTLTATDLGTTADDYAASTSTTGVVAVGGSVTGNIETLLDQDWFAITLAAGHTYQFDLQGAQSAQGTLFNPQLLLRDDVGASISANDNNNSSLDSQITFAITESKTYFLSALSSGAGGVGTYTLTATDLGTTADDYAASTSTTGVVAVGGSVTGNIETLLDQDWFAITLAAGHTYQFDLQGAQSAQGTLFNPQLLLRDDVGASISANDNNNSSLDSQITFAITESKTYFLSALSSGAGGVGTYTLTATDLGTTADDYAASTSTTGVVAVGGSVTGNIETLLDQDWFAITLAAGHTYQFDLQGAQSAQGTLFNPQLLLRDDVGASISANDNNNSSLDSQITFAITESKTYFLSALSSGAGGVGTYTLTATDLGTTADDYAASTSTTGVVAVGGSVTGNIETLLDQDWFATTLAAGHTYQFDLQGAQSAQGTLFNPQLLLRDDVGASISANDNNNSSLDSQITFAITESKTYFLSALSSGAGGVGTYTLTATDLSGAIPTNFDDTLLGTSDPDILDGLQGNDIIDGRDGADQLIGGDGNDALIGGDGSDILDGGANNDYLQGDGGGDTLYGGDGDDNMVGGTDADFIYGGNDNDLMSGNNGDDTLAGGSGLDSIIGGNGADIITGGDGNDYIEGNAGADNISGEEGDDIIVAGTENDTAYGGNGNDFVSGDAGDDQIFGGNGLDNIIGGDGADTINGDAGNDYIEGNAQVDTIHGNDGDDIIVAGDDNDIVYGDNSNDLLSGNEGDDQMYGGAGFDSLIGGNGADTLSGGDDADYLEGNGGADNISGDGGDDVIVAGANNDVAYGGNGNDFVSGEGGDDTLNGDAGFDTLIGGDGNDVLNGGADADYIEGNAGADTIHGDGGDDNIVAGDDNDTVYGDEGQDLLSGGNGNDTLDGGNGSDGLVGGSGDDTVYGGDGNDNIEGGAGADVIFGGNGNDIIDGGSSGDTMTGGAGNDIFVLHAGDADGDIIADFNGNGAGSGDLLRFIGFGQGYQGAHLTQIDATHWNITSADGHIHNTLTLSNGASIHSSDYIFL